MSAFGEAVAHVLAEEGGYVDHPRDPGGATNLGITLRTLSAWRGRDVTKAEVAALTPDEARAIYRRNYWDRIRGDELPRAVAIVTMDAAVNSGVTRAIQWLQQAAGVVADGAIGAKTLAAVRAANAQDLARECTRRRLDFLRGLSTWETFGKGWSRRVRRTLDLALEARHVDAR